MRLGKGREKDEVIGPGTGLVLSCPTDRWPGLAKTSCWNGQIFLRHKA